MKRSETLADFLKRTEGILYPGGSEEPATVSSRASDGDTPLHLAALWGDRHAAMLLIEAGAAVDAVGDMGCTPLYFAVMRENLLVAEVLVCSGANIHAQTDLGFSPLSLAKQRGNKDMIKVLKGR